MTGDLLNKYESDLKKAIEYLERELSGLRTGKASTALVEDIHVEAYGNPMQIKGVASISVPDPKSIIITPWDKSLVATIEKAIRTSELNLSPVNMGDNIRINIPPLTEERRRDLVKIVKDKGEDAKVALRNLRHEVIDKVKKSKTTSEITEDEAFKLDEQANKIISKYNEKVDSIVAAKQQEMMEI
ncbi:TPA: ribosome recycling factor [candidate division CPR2 bacterium]|uniref:Ribosome-recycling factor n=1 Tax=candidate division CPR2 bacterium GW2011_GWC1_41_48 TaxID=1618344 RepID=A0A0G0Z9I8_UNCC2|nr:MAG: Ribosome-recycling factor [candidate division CPR2 bacterium GW2011_GWC2_39_35]KKR27858.1 MAG: Ribosome-recycling factor [candidate division CPR2 bacterium GW2011_GWD2_39_7]KKR28728.1 MAG: Ribosome-recycling factor [candidate division CPR2 bacterium GW2011_GWD1_39_7]KKS09698.1 MAG: Ribosome-recycling factor [candidate division CPR2 bacterium GW2011_GWC1_41_48]OGB61375.1 MAG: ribosome recycling factor [candidate division CPR2 bacterium GWD1_39_7]OGB71957.1 MAG: ribosome recycling factor